MPKHPAPAKHQPATRHVAAKAVTKTAVAKHPVSGTPRPSRPRPGTRPRTAPGPGRHPAAVRRASRSSRRRPFQIYDSVTPRQIPAHHMVATYATGNYAASPAEVAGRRPVMWIDTTGSDYAASVLDVEPG